MRVLLDYEEIVPMLQQYDSIKRNELMVDGDFDTRESHFKIDELKAYIKHIEDLSKEKNIEITGINIIFAAYPDNHPKRNRQTLIFVPATRIGGEDNISFDPLLSKDRKPKPFADILSKFNYKLTYTIREATDVARASAASQSTASPVSIQGGSTLANRMGIKP